MPDENETVETPAQEAPPQDTPVTTTAPEAPAPEPVVEVEAPTEDPRIAQMQAEMAAMREQNATLLRIAEQRNMQPQAPQHDNLPDVDKLIEDSFEPGKHKDFMKAFAKAVEQKVAAKYASREEINVLQRATSAIAGNAEEQRAINALRDRRVPEADIKIVQQRAGKRAKELYDRGYNTDPTLIFEAELGNLNLERGYSNAAEAARKKAAVEANQKKAFTPVSTAQAGSGASKLTDEDYKKMDNMTMPEAGRYMRSKGIT